MEGMLNFGIRSVLFCKENKAERKKYKLNHIFRLPSRQSLLY